MKQNISDSLKQTLLPSLLSLIPLTANATSPSDLALEIKRTYDPRIEFSLKDTELSLFGCDIDVFEIMGLDPVTRQKRTVHVSIYRAEGERRNQPMVILLPPTGGVNILDRGYANELCSAGVTVALVSGWDHQNEPSLDFSMHDKGALRALAATRHVVEYLQTEEPRSIGILGTSVGAIAGTLVLGFEPRIRSAVLVVGSARFKDVIADSDEEGTVRLRNERMRTLGLSSLEEYRQRVRESVHVEPSAFLNNRTQKRTFVISADEDTTVRSEYQFELAEQLGAEVHLRLRGNHLQAIKESFFSHRKEIVGFFQRTLQSSADAELN